MNTTLKVKIYVGGPPENLCYHPYPYYLYKYIIGLGLKKNIYKFTSNLNAVQAGKSHALTSSLRSYSLIKLPSCFCSYDDEFLDLPLYCLVLIDPSIFDLLFKDFIN